MVSVRVRLRGEGRRDGQLVKDSWYCSFERGMDKMYDEKWKREEKKGAKIGSGEEEL